MRALQNSVGSDGYNIFNGRIQKIFAASACIELGLSRNTGATCLKRGHVLCCGYWVTNTGEPSRGVFTSQQRSWLNGNFQKLSSFGLLHANTRRNSLKCPWCFPMIDDALKFWHLFEKAYVSPHHFNFLFSSQSAVSSRSHSDDWYYFSLLRVKRRRHKAHDGSL